MKSGRFLGFGLCLSALGALLAASVPSAALAQQCIQVPVNCRVTSAFGPRFNPMTKTYSQEFHHGVDFGCPIGTPVVAADGGIVRVSGHSDTAGNWVVTNGAGGRVTYKYMHHERNTTTAGSMVNPGQALALTGNSGRSTGPHLHFQVEADGKAVDPMARFCTKPPLKEGVLQGGDAGSDILDAGSQATPPGDSGGIPPAMGLDGSLHEVMADVIASRALNQDYMRQLSTLSEPRLYAELAYLQAIRLKAAHERSQHRERILATQAMLQSLMTEAALRPQLESQRATATKATAVARP